VQKGLDLGVGQTQTLTITLKQATASEQIVVTATAPLIETARTEGATRIDQKAVEGLPNNGRNFLDYTKLTPGVTIVQGPDGDERPRGHRARQLQERLPQLAAEEPGRQRVAEVFLDPNPGRLHHRRTDPARPPLLLRRPRHSEGQLDEADRPAAHRAARRRCL